MKGEDDENEDNSESESTIKESSMNESGQADDTSESESEQGDENSESEFEDGENEGEDNSSESKSDEKEDEVSESGSESGEEADGKQNSKNGKNKGSSGTSSQRNTYYSDCEAAQKAGNSKSGIFFISPQHSQKPFLVKCDMETAGGGWTYIINRGNATQPFNLSWKDYKLGFGNVADEFWLGLDKIHSLTGTC